MAKSPDERYQTAQQLAEDLRAYLDNRPISAKPPSLADRAGKWARRHTAYVWAGAAAAAVIMATMAAAAAISVGIVKGTPMLDLNYAEDSSADVDLNVVMTDGGAFVEIQGTAEREPFPRSDLDSLLELAQSGIEKLVGFQNAVRTGA